MQSKTVAICPWVVNGKVVNADGAVGLRETAQLVSLGEGRIGTDANLRASLTQCRA